MAGCRARIPFPSIAYDTTLTEPRTHSFPFSPFFTFRVSWRNRILQKGEEKGEGGGDETGSEEKRIIRSMDG